MKFRRTVLGTWLLLVCFCAVLGCEKPAAKDNKALESLGLGYQNFCNARKNGPASAEELKDSMHVGPDVVEAIKSGKIVVIWGVDIIEAMAKSKPGGPGISEQVLAYEATVPDSGGRVLMGNTTVRNMTATEFKAASKAQPKK